VTSKIRAAMFWCGLLIYVSSFSLAAIVDVDFDTVRPGYDCAVWSVVAVAMIGNLFRFQFSALQSILESASILFTALINPLFLLYVIASPFRPADRTVRISRLLIPLMIPFCWVIFHYENYRPREGLFWILGMPMVLVSGLAVKRPTPGD
jgi:hypothetical protein